MPNEKKTGRYPNRLRAVRTAACLTRAQVSQLTSSLVGENCVLYAEVSVATLKALELGWSRPRLRTASSLAKVLESRPAEVFTSGFDDSVRRGPALENK